MPDESCFSERCPPLCETFSFRNKPCRYEESSNPQPEELFNAGSKPCTFGQFCASSAPALKMLEWTYGPWIQVTMSEPSSSIVVRSEHQYHRNEHYRHSLRKHFYEVLADGKEQDVPSWLEIRFSTTSLHRLRALRCPAVLQVALEPVLPLVKNWADDRISFKDSKALKAELLKYISEDQWEGIWPLLLRTASFRAYGCYECNHRERYGTYLGFVDLRINSPRTPLAMALLRPPRALRTAPEVVLITGEYGPVFGAPAFLCSVYSMHDSQSGGAWCAQACIIMALGLLSDRGAQLMGSFELSALGLPRSPHAPGTPPGISPSASQPSERSSPDVAAEPPCLATLTKFPPTSSFRVAGLKPIQIAAVLGQNGSVTPHYILVPPPEANTGAVPDDLRQLWNGIALRLIEAYLVARLPVILFVNTQTWYSRGFKRVDPEGHAVLLTGIRYRDWSVSGHPAAHAGRATEPEARLLNLIVHDPGYLPFYERSVTDCLAAAWDFSALPVGQAPGASRAEDAIRFLAVGDVDLGVVADRCIIDLLVGETGFDRASVLQPSSPIACDFDLTTGVNQPLILDSPSLDSPLLEFQTRLRSEVRPLMVQDRLWFATFLMSQNTQSPTGTPPATARFLIRLLHGESIDAASFWPSNRELEETLSGLVDAFLRSNLLRRRYWCIMGLDAGRVSRVWLFDAEERPWEHLGRAHPQWTIRLCSPDAHSVQMWRWDAEGYPVDTSYRF